MDNILEDIKKLILHQIHSELETMDRYRNEVRLPRSEIVKNLCDSYKALTMDEMGGVTNGNEHDCF